MSRMCIYEQRITEDLNPKYSYRLFTMHSHGHYNVGPYGTYDVINLFVIVNQAYRVAGIEPYTDLSIGF